MPFVLSDRVQETATANTTVSFTLTGAVAGFQSFGVGIGPTNTTYYSATDASGNWEVGFGTYSSTGPTLTRTTVYASSNSGSAETFSGTVNVFVTYPASKSVNLDSSGNVSPLGTVASGTWQGSVIDVAYGGTGVGSATGTGSIVKQCSPTLTSPTFTAPVLGTPTSGNFGSGTFTWPTFNQNTTGSAGSLSGTVAIANGGTGQNSQQDALNALSGTQTANRVLRSNGTNVTLQQVQLSTDVTGSLPASNLATAYGDSQNPYASKTLKTFLAAPILANGLPSFRVIDPADIPTLNQNTTGTAANVSGTVAIANGGTGQTTRQPALNALVGTQTANRVLRSDGTNSTLAQVALATDVSGTLPVANGGTGQTTYTNGQLLIGNSTGNTLTKATLTAGSGVTITNGAGAITISASGGGGGGGCPATPTTAGIVYGLTQSICCGARVALGYNAGGAGLACYGYAIAIGANSSIGANCSIAIGNNATTTSCASTGIAIGNSAGAVGNDAISIGRNSAVAGSSIGIGAGVCVGSATGSVAVGSGSTANSDYQVVIGYCSLANGANANVIGANTFVGCAANKTFIGPIRNATATYTLKYNPCTREVTYV